jgi:hypothetical protein|tara:strand:+ start:9140 stop:9463 length:324 start_codon:yes stop_codon:yes gene_type:complete
VTIGEAGEGCGQPGVRVDADEFAVLDERGDHGPVIATLVGSGEQGIFAIEGERADGAFDGVIVEIEAAIIKEADEPVPTGQRIADRLAQTALGADLTEPGFEVSMTE